MTVADLINVLPAEVKVRVVKNEKDISIAEGLTLTIKEALPTAKNKMTIKV